MGDINYSLAPAAILLDHPGLTLREFARRLNQVNVGLYTLTHLDPAFLEKHFCFSSNMESGFHGGIIQTAGEVLGLEVRGLSEEEFGALKIRPRHQDRRWLNPTYRYISQKPIREDLETAIEYNGPCNTEPKVGMRFNFPKLGMTKRTRFESSERTVEVKGGVYNPPFRIAEVKESVRTTTKKQGIPSDKERTLYLTRLCVQEVIPVYFFEDFKSLRDLLKTHPEYDPRNLFDLNQQRGKLAMRDYYGELFWFQKNGKYFLDLGAIFDSSKENYSSIVLTAEAIRRKAWSLMRYLEGRNFEREWLKFRAKSPKTIARHGAAVALYWACKYAQDKQMTITEWLRLNALQEAERAANIDWVLNEKRFLEEIQAEQDRRIEEARKIKIEPQKDDLLF